jgi:hypothetical protein
MADLTFNTPSGQTIARELLIAYLNTGTASAPVWSPLGKRVEESSTELDWESEISRDILGATYGTLKKPKITRRYTIQSNEDRLRIAQTLEDLAAWAKENPPEHTHLKVTGLPEFTSRNNSGIEDISITLMLTE